MTLVLIISGFAKGIGGRRVSGVLGFHHAGAGTGPRQQRRRRYGRAEPDRLHGLAIQLGLVSLGSGGSAVWSKV